jgi:hypothetical protein
MIKPSNEGFFKEKNNMVFTGNADVDYIAVVSLIDSFANKSGQKINYDKQKIFSIIQYLDKDFPCINGLENANIFKKASRFLCDFVAERPVDGFNVSNAKLEKINNYRSTVIGFHIVCAFIKDATVGKGTVKNPIALSQHSYIDIIDSLSQITSTHFNIVAVFLEQLVYKSNPLLQNNTFELGS